jgi:hypothetical protein
MYQGSLTSFKEEIAKNFVGQERLDISIDIGLERSWAMQLAWCCLFSDFKEHHRIDSSVVSKFYEGRN